MTTHDDISAMLRDTLWRTSFLQAIVVVAGLGMAWQAAECALLGHHGHAILCGIGVAINVLSYEIATRTRAAAKEALDSRLA